MDIGGDYVQSPTLLGGHFLLLANYDGSKLVISVTDLHNPDLSTIFYLPAITGFVTSGLTWLTEDQQLDQTLFSLPRPHDVCILDISLETEHWSSHAVSLVIKFNDLFQFVSDHDNPHFDWSEWGPKCARFLPTTTDEGIEGAINGSRVIFRLPEDMNTFIPPQEKPSQVSILDFNPSLVPMARDRKLRVVEGELHDKVFSDVFLRPSEAANGVPFTVLGPVPGVPPGSPVMDIHLTQSAIFLDGVSVFELEVRYLRSERPIDWMLSGWGSRADQNWIGVARVLYA